VSREYPYTLPVRSLRVVAVADTSVALPPHPGSALRGAFGHALRAAACLVRAHGAPCETCVENARARAEGRETRCVYGYLFDTPRPPASRSLKGQQEAPHPYVIRPETTVSGRMVAGDRFAFMVQLFGHAIAHAGIVAEACVRMGRLGLGAGRGTMTVVEVQEWPVFERRVGSPSATALPADAWEAALVLADEMSGTGTNIVVDFLTPTRITSNKQPVVRPEFGVVVRAALRRLHLLAAFHGGSAPLEYFADLTTSANDVRRVSWRGRWEEWERFSTRQERRMTLGGFVGSAVYQGDDLRPYLPYLIYGQAVHLGKWCTFGCGQYRMAGDDTDRLGVAPSTIVEQ